MYSIAFRLLGYADETLSMLENNFLSIRLIYVTYLKATGYFFAHPNSGDFLASQFIDRFAVQPLKKIAAPPARPR